MSRKILLERSNVVGGRAGPERLPASVWCALFVAGIPLLMAAHIVVNHFVVRRIGLAGILLYPETLFALLFGVLPLWGRGLPRESDRSWTALLVLSLVIAFWFGLCAVIQRAPVRYWPGRVVMDWIVPPAVGIAFRLHLDGEGWRRTRAALIWSALAAGIVTIALYFFSFGFPESFRELIFQNRTYRMQFGLKRGIPFGELTFGGMNDVAAYFGAVLVIVMGWLADRTETRPAALLAVFPMLAIEALCYSRGALLALFGVVALQGLQVLRRRKGIPPMFGVSTAAVALLAILLILPQGAVDYWRNQLEAGEGSTSQVRLDMWKTVGNAQETKTLFESNLPDSSIGEMRAFTLEIESHRGADKSGSTVNQRFERVRNGVIRNIGGLRRRLLFGYGLGNYGIIAGTMPEMGAHNVFLDGFLGGGVIGLELLLAFWSVWLWRLTRLFSSGSAAGSVAPLSAGVFFTLVGVLVSIRLVNLGTAALGSLFWLFASASPSAVRRSDADE